ncbi:MAG TPA: MBL fold metallo-hydrolase [Candidatus Saccharimonadales bacterium]|nr:MBL fold metallo-hydrolase [Candidatus Saccharimonadales bacterium]
MEIEYKGANCIVITHKKDVFVTDPKLSRVGLKDYSGPSVAQIITQDERIESNEGVIINGPGEYEVRNCSIKGIAAKSHHSLEKEMPATMYRLDLEELSIAIIGHVDSNLTEEQLEELGLIDILIVPIGGYGFTLDAKSAAELVRKVEPKVVIPTHYADETLKYEVPQDSIETFIKEMGSPVEEAAKLRVKPGTLPATLTICKVLRTK